MTISSLGIIYCFDFGGTQFGVLGIRFGQPSMKQVSIMADTLGRMFESLNGATRRKGHLVHSKAATKVERVTKFGVKAIVDS